MPEDYGQWSSIYDLQLSEKGNWCSYRLAYESGRDTLMVRSTTGKQVYALPKGSNGAFNGDQWFGCLNENRFTLLNLVAGKQESFDDVDEFEFAGNGKYVLFHSGNENNQRFIIKNLSSGSVSVLPDVTAFSVSPTGNFVAVTVATKHGNSVLLIGVNEHTSINEVIEDSELIFSTIEWQGNGDSFAFVGTPIGEAHAVMGGMYRVPTKLLLRFDNRSVVKWPDGAMLNCSQTGSINISNDGERLFFSMSKNNPDKKTGTSAVQIWNAADKILYPTRSRRGEIAGQVLVWWPDTNQFYFSGAERRVADVLNGNQDYLISYDCAPYQPSLKYGADRDYYITNLSNGETSMILKRQFYEYSELFASTDGKYLSYFRDGNWWVYDILRQKHTCITSKFTVALAGPYEQEPQVPAPFGLAGWSKDGKAVFVYDEFDLWEVAVDGSKANRLTKGREQQTVFRIPAGTVAAPFNTAALMRTVAEVALKATIVLAGNKLDGSLSGLYILGNGKMRTLVDTPKQIRSVLKSQDNRQVIYITEDYDSPPEIMAVSSGTGKSKQIFRSNPQHDRYDWGKSELIQYWNERCEPRSAVLFYPFNYDPAKKYPMVVHVYMDQLHTLYRYVNPTMLNSSGYNTTNFTSNGYFVLHPNIVFQTGSRGLSASKCIQEAVEAAIETVPVDRAKIGLMGHSFGGFAALFTITQTPLFAAAVSGSGISDLTSGYFSMGWNHGNAETWRYEYQQLGVGIPFYESQGIYKDNSPISFADRVQTPLLSWTGGSDKLVDPSQTMAFYMAMRRLKKEHVMLWYPGEDHALTTPENEVDVTTKIMQWFDHYLKGAERPEWCKEK